MSNFVTGLRNMPINSALRWATGSGVGEFLVKANLTSLEGSVGKTGSRIVHELMDYPQTVMAGVIASRFFQNPRISNGIFYGSMAVPLFCKGLELMGYKIRLTRAVDHLTRISGKVINVFESGRRVWKAPEFGWNYFKELGQAVVLTLLAVKDFKNTREYSQSPRARNFYSWNRNEFSV